MKTEIMSGGDIREMLDKASLGLGLTLEEAKLLFNVEGENFKKLLKTSLQTFFRKTGGKVSFYEKAFPPISITGYNCELNCKHCNKYYLKHMIPVENQEKLVNVGRILHKQGIKGVLLSGGSRKDGVVPLNLYLDAIKILKEKFNFFIEAHTGLIGYEDSNMLVKAGVDAMLPDVVGDVETTMQVYGLNVKLEEYEKMLDGMKKAGVKNVSPHVCIGLNFGRIKGELNALKIVSKHSPSVLVLTILIPTVGTPMEKVQPPKPEDVAKIIAIANLMLPETPISLGCVRPGGVYRNIVDSLAIKAGVSSVAVPSESALTEAKRLGLNIKRFKENMCCCAVNV
ncbi:MAG: radical SAM protein [Candidatus Bathyarchaeota archaeon]